MTEKTEGSDNQEKIQPLGITTESKREPLSFAKYRLEGVTIPKQSEDNSLPSPVVPGQQDNPHPDILNFIKRLKK